MIHLKAIQMKTFLFGDISICESIRLFGDISLDKTGVPPSTQPLQWKRATSLEFFLQPGATLIELLVVVQ